MARIACLDLDTFFVSVERLLDPSLVGVPLIIGGDPKGRGVVTSCSYEVRTFGVRSGMSAWEAAKLAPDAVFRPGRHGVYGDYAARVRTVAERSTPLVQTASIDEFFLDFRGCERLWARPDDPTLEDTVARVCREIRDTVLAEVGLPCSLGIGRTRSLAKMASGKAKPAGVWLVRPGEEEAFVRPLPVRKLPGLGPVAASHVNAAGITTLGELLDLPSGPLRARFGGWGARLRDVMHGAPPELRPDRPAFREHDPRGAVDGGISNEHTFHADLGDRDAVWTELRALVERVAWRVRQRGVLARTVALKLRYADFHTLTRSSTGPPTDDERQLMDRVTALLDAAWTRRRALRLVGVGLSNLELPGPQLQLPARPGSRPALGVAIDAVRARFGYEAVRLGRAEG
jgi:DNA polymerase-4